MRLPQSPARERRLPAHPFRDSALLYGGLAIVILVVGIVTGSGIVKPVAVAVAFFIAATAWSWWRFRERIEERARR